MSHGLQGVAVLVTRPRDQATALVGCLEREGASVILAPGIEIEPVPTAAPADVGNLDWLVFVSRNAVRHGTTLLAGSWQARPAAPAVAAVGPGTAEELTRFGWWVDAAPASGGGGADLLATPGFSAGAGDRVVIVRGEGGNETLADGLRGRGAGVGYCEVYRRRACPVDPSMLASDWQSASQRVTIVTSADSIRALVTALPAGERADVLESRPVVLSDRLARVTQAIGFTAEPVVAAGSEAGELVTAAREAAGMDEETP